MIIFVDHLMWFEKINTVQQRTTTKAPSNNNNNTIECCRDQICVPNPALLPPLGTAVLIMLCYKGTPVSLSYASREVRA